MKQLLVFILLCALNSVSLGNDVSDIPLNILGYTPNKTQINDGSSPTKDLELEIGGLKVNCFATTYNDEWKNFEFKRELKGKLLALVCLGIRVPMYILEPEANQLLAKKYKGNAAERIKNEELAQFFVNGFSEKFNNKPSPFKRCDKPEFLFGLMTDYQGYFWKDKYNNYLVMQELVTNANKGAAFGEFSFEIWLMSEASAIRDHKLFAVTDNSEICLDMEKKHLEF